MSATAPIGALLPLALSYANRQKWLVFPLRGKIPDGELASEGLYNATRSPATLGFWWNQRPNANIGIATGERSGLLVLDVDPRHGGADTLAALEAQHEPLPTTVRVRTGTGGLHVYLRYPKVGRYGNTAGRLGPGLDTRGEGGYVVAAGSVHPDTGRPYVWLAGHGPDEVQLTEAPAWLLDLLADKPRPAAAPVSIPAGSGRSRYAEKALEDELRTVAGAVESTRNATLNTAAFSLGQLVAAGLLDEATVEGALLQAAIATGLGEREAVKTIRSGLGKGMRAPREIPPPAGAKVIHLPVATANGHGGMRSSDGDEPPTLLTPGGPYEMTDDGNALRLVARHGRDLRYCHTTKEWYAWDGRRWRVDATGEVERRAKDTARAILHEAAAETDERKQEHLLKHARASQAAARIRAMIELASSEPGIAVTLGQLDADDWLFCCANGVIDLRTGRLEPHDRAHLITKMSPVAYDPDAAHPVWDHFVAWATNDDDELAGFLRREAGYALTGDTREEKLFFHSGKTAAGKSTYAEALRAVWGDYAATADFETFLKRSQVGGPRDDIARLAGARLVISIEVDEGKKLAEGLVKSITGGDTVAARHLYQRSFEFVPRFKLLLSANHAPKVRDDDDAMWRRILRVPFTRDLERDGTPRDPSIKATLRDPAAGGPAVLAWAVKGCLAWQRTGLGVPRAVNEATRAYRDDMDPLAGFFGECCRFADDAALLTKALREALQAWAKDTGTDLQITPNELAERLSAKGCTPAKFAQGARGWRGITLVQVAPDDPAGVPEGGRRGAGGATCSPSGGTAATAKTGLFELEASKRVAAGGGVSANYLDVPPMREYLQKPPPPPPPPPPEPPEPAGDAFVSAVAVGDRAWRLRGGGRLEPVLEVVGFEVDAAGEAHAALSDGTSWPAEELEPVLDDDGGVMTL